MAYIDAFFQLEACFYQYGRNTRAIRYFYSSKPHIFASRKMECVKNGHIFSFQGAAPGELLKVKLSARTGSAGLFCGATLCTGLVEGDFLAWANDRKENGS